MELILVRHALPLRVENDTVDEAADPALSEVGLEQARRLGDWLRDDPIEAVYASPMRRALQTAEPVAAAHGLAVVCIDNIAEYDRHHHEYVPVEELKRANDERWQAIVRGEYPDPGMDMAGFRARVVTAINELVAAHSGGRIAVVCHGGVILAYLSDVLGLPEPSNFFYPNYTSIHRVMASRSGVRSIVSLNEVAHLRHTGLLSGLVP